MRLLLHPSTRHCARNRAAISTCASGLRVSALRGSAARTGQARCSNSASSTSGRKRVREVYPRETQEMVFDAHDRAFALFKGTCGRGIYDNMNTAVETVFVGKDRLYNRRFLQMCSHYLVDPVACTPASGWEKGQVENQVGLVRECFFTPRLSSRDRFRPAA
jgi:transposase